MTFEKRLWRNKLFHLGIILSIGILRYGSEWFAGYLNLQDLPALGLALLVTATMWLLLIWLYRRATASRIASG